MWNIVLSLNLDQNSMAQRTQYSRAGHHFAISMRRIVASTLAIALCWMGVLNSASAHSIPADLPPPVISVPHDHSNCISSALGLCLETNDLIIVGASSAAAIAVGASFGDTLGLAGGSGLLLALYVAHIPAEALLFGSAGVAVWKSLSWIWGGDTNPQTPSRSPKT